MGSSGLSYVEAIRAAAPDVAAPASIFDGRTRSWGELMDRAARLAAGLRDLGVGPGDRVAVLAANSDRYMELYLAIPWAGAVIAPLNPRWSAEENRYAIGDCTPKLILAGDGAGAETLELLSRQTSGRQPIWLGSAAAPEGWTEYETVLAAAPMDPIPRQGDDLFGIFYTGGTTGRSKGVMLSHAGLVGNCRAIRAAGVFPDGCRGLVVAPLFHLAAGAVLSTIMMTGGTAVILGAFAPAATLDAIDAGGVTDALLVPTMIQMVLDDPAFDPARLAGLSRIIYGASPIAEATLDRMMAAAPHVDFYQAYGMTEVSCAATILKPEFHVGAHRAAGRHRAAGQAIADTEVMIADENDQPRPIGEVGEILVRGAGLMLGYWGQPELTAEALRGGWMHTGDGGRMDELGLVYVVDRIKDMIVTGGENVYSGEVESALAKHPAVAQCAVIGVPDERWGERVHAIIVPRAGALVSADELMGHCRGLIAGYKCPKTLELRTEPLPLSAAGKVLKHVLREPHWQGRERNVA
jgi:long-chain acyl-CoA synthetase